MNIHIHISRRVFNPAYLPYLDNDDRYLIFYGGGSSGKSHFIAQRYIYRLIRPGRCNLLVVRQTAETNRRSTFALLKQVMRQWHLTEYFKVNESDLRIRCLLTGNEVAFLGLDDVEKIKSITFENGELTDIWVEEASETREEDINQLKIRLRGGKSKKQMVLSFNPTNVRHWLKRHFIDSGEATCCHTTHLDNRFLTDADRWELEKMRTLDPYTYRVYCLGQWGVLGDTVFSSPAIQRVLDQGATPVAVGRFEYRDTGLTLEDIRWVEDEGGPIRIYAQPGSSVYCIGGDTAGEGSDYFAAQVIDAVTGQQAAVLHHRFDADLYAKQVFCLGRHYGSALVGIEANFDSFPIRELQRLGYANQYVRPVQDTYTGRLEKAYGFRTTSLTRPTILSRLMQIVREDCGSIRDRATLEELLTIVRSQTGRIEAPQGGHDDLMMALAIAHEIRSQVRIPVEAPPEPRGERITVV